MRQIPVLRTPPPPQRRMRFELVEVEVVVRVDMRSRLHPMSAVRTDGAFSGDLPLRHLFVLRGISCCSIIVVVFFRGVMVVSPTSTARNFLFSFFFVSLDLFLRGWVCSILWNAWVVAEGKASRVILVYKE